MAEHGEAEAFVIAPILALDPILQSIPVLKEAVRFRDRRAERVGLSKVSFGSDKPHSRADFAISWRFIQVINATAAAGDRLALRLHFEQRSARRVARLRGFKIKQRVGEGRAPFRISIARPSVRASA